MGQDLTRRYVDAGNVAPIFVKPHNARFSAEDRRLSAEDRPWRRPVPRPTLPFRSVNLAGRPGYDPGLQRHHLLPRQLLSKRCFGTLFDEIGREWPGLDDFRSNGMLLPSSDAAALRIGLPLHRGPHRNYNAMVIERVGQVEAHWSNVRLRAPTVAHGDAVASLQLLQRALRRRLLDPSRKPLALNRHDPLGHAVDFTHIDAMVDALWPASDPLATAPGLLTHDDTRQLPVFVDKTFENKGFAALRGLTKTPRIPVDQRMSFAPAMPLYSVNLAVNAVWA